MVGEESIEQRMRMLYFIMQSLYGSKPDYQGLWFAVTYTSSSSYFVLLHSYGGSRLESIIEKKIRAYSNMRINVMCSSSGYKTSGEHQHLTGVLGLKKKPGEFKYGKVDI
jgi:hypothetical protein